MLTRPLPSGARPSQRNYEWMEQKARGLPRMPHRGCLQTLDGYPAIILSGTRASPRNYLIRLLHWLCLAIGVKVRNTN